MTNGITIYYAIITIPAKDICLMITGKINVAEQANEIREMMLTYPFTENYFALSTLKSWLLNDWVSGIFTILNSKSFA